MSIVRENLMARKGYTPYCGNNSGRCDMPRTHFFGNQFYCSSCGWESQFPKEFIKEYKKKWNL